MRDKLNYRVSGTWFSHDVSVRDVSRGPRRPRPTGASNTAHRVSSKGHEILRARVARAIAWGYRPAATGTPCSRITRYRRPLRGRLLVKAARELRGRLAMTAFSEGVLSGVCIDAPLSEHARRGEYPGGWAASRPKACSRIDRLHWGEAVWLSISGPKTLLEELQRGAKTALTAQTAPMKDAMGAMGAILQAFSGRQDKRPVSRGEASCPGVVPHAAHALNQDRIARLGSSRRTCPLPSAPGASAPVAQTQASNPARTGGNGHAVRHRAASIVPTSLGTSIASSPRARAHCVRAAVQSTACRNCCLAGFRTEQICPDRGPLKHDAVLSAPSPSEFRRRGDTLVIQNF